MALALLTSALRRTLRDKEIVLTATPSGNYPGVVQTAIAPGAFVQASAGQPLNVNLTSLAALSGNVTFTSAGGAGGGNQVVNLATYTGLTSTNKATAQAAANALAAALTAGALGTASHSVYSAILNPVSATSPLVTLSIYTNNAAEVLSVTASTGQSTTLGGDTVNLAGITIPPGLPSDGSVGYPGQITQSEVIRFAGGYLATLVPGPNLSNWQLVVYSAPGTVLASGAYPAAILADFFQLRLVGPKLRF